MATALARREAAPASSADAVVCERVTVRFTTERGTVTALENIDLTIPRGSFLTLLGPSGCGKSTLLRVMADLIEPTSESNSCGERAPGSALPPPTSSGSVTFSMTLRHGSKAAS